MRESQIYDMNQRRAQNEAVLYRQLTFLNTRMEAYETVLSSRLAMARAFLDPIWLQRAVNTIQMALMKAHDDQMREAAEKAKEEAKKPKIEIVGTNGLTHGR